MKEAYERIHYLTTSLNIYTESYDNGCPKISDKEWDDMYFELLKLEEESGLILPTSPTQNIPYTVVSSLAKVEHNHKMLSLAKTKSVTDVVAFIGNKPFIVMYKLDGLTCTLTYEDGVLIAAETRGNGIVGEDILHNARVLRSIPKRIPHKGRIVIDGEIICTYDDFDYFSHEYKNPRNFAAGSIRLLDSAECAKRKLTFVAWEVITPMYFEDGIEYRLSQKLDYLSDFGFITVPYKTGVGLAFGETEYQSLVDEIQNIKSMFPIDGAVFKFDDCAYGRSLGETSHHFKNAIAYKFYDETYETELRDIEWTMGRTGALTPVAIFNPIDIDGSIVERASLHNPQIILDIFGNCGPYVGQTIHVFKANMIIPQIAKAEEGLWTEEMRLNIPARCPVCGGQLKNVMSDNSQSLVCTETSCPGKLINRLDHFCGKKGLDIKGLSKATLEKLIDWGWIFSISDLFKVENYRAEWIQKAGFGQKSVDKILGAIATSAKCDPAHFISSLGIPLIGITASKELIKYFETYQKLRDAVENKFEFYTLPNFGIEMHKSLHDFNWDEADFIIQNQMVQFNAPEENEDKSESSGEDLVGKVFVITGKVTHFKNRDALKAKIESLGGKVTGSVSKKTNYLINNDKNSTSAKNQSALSLNIPILSEEEFLETFGIK